MIHLTTGIKHIIIVMDGFLEPDHQDYLQAIHPVLEEIRLTKEQSHGM